MRCSRCQKNTAKYIVESFDFASFERATYLCDACYRQAQALGENLQKLVPMSENYCPFCGNRMEDYLRTGLVGCAECYTHFEREMYGYIYGLQHNDEHRGKELSKDPKYEAAQSLRELLLRQAQAEREGNDALALKYRRNAEELKLILFGDDEEE
ncbi:MAG: hypothetical protein J6S22_02600 [Clostridia bacterium]|nr:hypothetical protein [Clostridia bacterium]